MAEVYPNDNELLNILSDAETGVEYIPTGLSPYYVQFRRLLYRLVLSVRRGNDLRVYDEGGLDMGVKSGKFWTGTTIVNFAGAAGVGLADNKDAIYVYLDAVGSLVTNEYSGFPDMKAAAHIRLAVVKTAGGDIVSITDSRSGHNFVMPYGAGGVKRSISAHTADYTLQVSESGSVHTNRGSGGVVTITLPASAAEGTNYSFAVQEARQLRIKPGATAAIRDSSGQTAGKYKAATAIGDNMTIVADAGGNWAVVSRFGTWTEET